MHRHHENFRQRLFILASQNAAYFAAVGFVVLQVSIGIVMKASQNEKGQYGFSASGCVTVSEFCKFVLSTLLFWAEIRRRRKRSPPTAEHVALPTSEQSSLELDDLSDDGLDDELTGDEKAVLLDDRTSFWRVFLIEIPVDKRFGFGQLALLYALINNTIFVAYKLADPGTISLTRSGVTFITALVMICALGTRITKIQWTAIVLQVFGLIVSQYHAKTGMSYPITTYLVLLFQVFLSAVSGVYNQALLKGGNASLHASNMMLYLSGVLFNLTIHLTTRLLNPLEPGFFTGYSHAGAILVILSNVFMGIAISAVFKYADAVIKCLATAVSTGILLYLSPILFDIPMNPLIVPGAAVVLISSWLYMETAMSKEQQKEDISSGPSYTQSLVDDLSAWATEHRRVVLGVGAVLTIAIASFLGSAKASMPDLRSTEAGTGTKDISKIPGSILESPFKNTLAFIRWNNEDHEQIPLLQKYSPFFNTLHFSIPTSPPSNNQNLTHDSWDDSNLTYKQVSQTMQHLLDTPSNSDIEGLLFFTHDAWIDPLDFSREDPTNLWIPSSSPPNGSIPLTCTTNPKTDNNLLTANKDQAAALQAVSTLHLTDFPYNVNPKEYCIGWSDIYYVPRRFFVDFIFLSKLFNASKTAQEIAVPTILQIIDQSRRDHPYRSILTRLGDCWTQDAGVDAVLGYRCGGRIDYQQKGVVDAGFEKLDGQARLLGMELGEMGARNWTREGKGGDVCVYYQSIGWDDVDTKEEVEELLEVMGELVREDLNSNSTLLQ